MSPQLEAYWNLRNHLYTIDGVVLMRDMVLIPPSLPVLESLIPPPLCSEVMQSLHAAHQGVSAIHERAKSAVFWPGITKDMLYMKELSLQSFGLALQRIFYT